MHRLVLRMVRARQRHARHQIRRQRGLERRVRYRLVRRRWFRVLRVDGARVPGLYDVKERIV